MGVAVSLLDDQTNSLVRVLHCMDFVHLIFISNVNTIKQVGVAISASLLPPAVNSGIILISWYFKNENTKLFLGSQGDWAYYAFVSLGLTLVNILMIWISSILMFRMKEVLPIKKSHFWSDLGIARKIYRGKAVLAHQAFDPESRRPELGKSRSLWRLARENLPTVSNRATVG